MSTMSVGAVVIGRNEGQRLVNCLQSLVSNSEYIVYVDSGSSDNSVEEAKKLGVDVVSLDMNQPFTAARARNEGAKRLLSLYPTVNAIQFVDGDCEVQADWLGKAIKFLCENSDVAIVCGRRRERHPEQSIYNQLCDIEWDTPVGEAMACGGDALVRVEAYQQVNGYREDLIAGEEPEMCFRLRHEGWKIVRLDAEMTLHDAAMTKFSQWWKRTVRAGYAYALGSSIHGDSEERYWVREKQRILFWGIALPVVAITLGLWSTIFIGLLLFYPLQIFRVGQGRPDLGQFRFFWASSVVLGKLPEAWGLLRFYADRLSGHNVNIIEYK